jgi:hypothetical protein
MPDLTQTELPKPKTWDAVEAIACDIYARRWLAGLEEAGP